MNLTELDFLKEKSITLNTFFDLLTLNEYLIEENLE
jgi:hypothetical protein